MHQYDSPYTIRDLEEFLMKKTITKKIPNLPGVYLFKNNQGDVIYIGKAKSLKTRVNSYFQKQHPHDWKLNALLDDYADIDYIITPTETEALLLETQLIQQYKPKYNALLKEGQPFLYIFFTQEELPRMKLVRNKKHKGVYFGPFLQKMQARKVYQFLLQTFQLNICNKKIPQGCLDYHLGTCPGSCKPDFDSHDYIFRLQLAMDVLKNNSADFKEKIENQIIIYNKNFAFEKSKHLHDYLQHLDAIFMTIKTAFTETKYAYDIATATTPLPLNNNTAIAEELQLFLGLKEPVHSIDCFDISHFQSKQMVGSCIRFTNGKPDKNNFRRFTIKTLHQQNDYAALQEIVMRRYKNDNFPDVILIDGGKGQLHAVQEILPTISCISLAKREERLYSSNNPEGIILDVNTEVGKLLIALRDYAHHFAISYHRLKRKKAVHAE